MQTIILACWVIFILYWISQSRSVKPTQETAWRPSNLRWVIIVLVALFLLAGRLRLFHFVHIPSCVFALSKCGSSLFPSLVPVPYAVKLFGTMLVICGLCIAIVARRTIGSNWSGNIDVKKGHELITKGIYGYMRHPIYSGILLMSFGVLVFSASVSMLLFFVALSALFTFKLIQEEKLMQKHFPKAYALYKKRVKALIPYIL